MFKISKLYYAIILSLLIVIIMAPTCYGNSAEPPSILIIVPNAPDDLEISIGSENNYAKASITDKVIERYYAFYSHELRITNDHSIKINTGGRTFEILLEEPLKSYNNIFTLDLDNQKLTSGKLLSRSISLVSLRIILTLFIEGIVFWLFGFKYKRSWIAFLIINLITQGALNIWLNGFGPLGSYLILTLVFGEMLVFLVEVIACLKFIKEYSRTRTFLYVIIANCLSLIVGGYIITFLPV